LDPPLATYYQTLGVQADADAETLRRAYRRLARRFHPDINPDPNSTSAMAIINEAFWTLIDPARRHEYDAMLRAGIAAPRSNGAKTKSPISVRLHLRLRVHHTPVYGLSFAPDTGWLASSSFDNEVLWWDASSGSQLRRVKLEAGSISTLRQSLGGRLVVAGTSESAIGACVVDAAGAHSWRFTQMDWPSCVAVSADSRRVAVGTILHKTAITDVETGKILAAFDDHSGSVTAVAWSHDGKYLASGSSDTKVNLRDGSSGRTMYSFDSAHSTVTALAFSPDDRFIAVAGADLAVRVVSLADGSTRKVLYGHTRPIEAVAFHPNGWLFATGGRDGSLGIWNASDGLGQAFLAASARPILALEFSADGSKLASSGLDKTVRVWSIRERAGT
jgi:WD40 repeat protein